MNNCIALSSGLFILQVLLMILSGIVLEASGAGIVRQLTTEASITDTKNVTIVFPFSIAPDVEFTVPGFIPDDGIPFVKPSNSPSPSLTPSPSVTPSVSPTTSSSPSASTSGSPSASPSANVSVSITPSATASQSPSLSGPIVTYECVAAEGSCAAFWEDTTQQTPSNAADLEASAPDCDPDWFFNRYEIMAPLCKVDCPPITTPNSPCPIFFAKLTVQIGFNADQSLKADCSAQVMRMIHESHTVVRCTDIPNTPVSAGFTNIIFILPPISTAVQESFNTCLGFSATVPDPFFNILVAEHPENLAPGAACN